MKIIFLDFDGVINNWNKFDGIDEANVINLKEIIHATSAKIVVTSSKKYSFQKNIDVINYKETQCYNEYVKPLNNLGVEIYDFTPYVNGNREEEIIKYLSEHSEITEYLILDDDYVFENLKDHEVFVDLYKGICSEHVLPSINILNGNLGFYPVNFINYESEKEKCKRINEYYNKKRKESK